MSRRSRLPDAAFFNVPYDAKHEELFLAFLAGLSGFALIPRATLEILGSQRRLDRIVCLLRRCRYSFHDLSGVELDRHRRQRPGSICRSSSVWPWRWRRTGGSARYRDVSEHASEIKSRLRTSSVFEARAFRELVAAAQTSASRRVASLRNLGRRHR
jgi:hypothetical protein